jgi:hypothetical protein
MKGSEHDAEARVCLTVNYMSYISFIRNTWGCLAVKMYAAGGSVVPRGRCGFVSVASV